jgi:hypothetical protein
MMHLRAWGFDATSGTSSLTALEEAPERHGVRPEEAAATMARVLFLPAYPEISTERRGRLAEALAAWAARSAGGATGRGEPAAAARGA